MIAHEIAEALKPHASRLREHIVEREDANSISAADPRSGELILLDALLDTDESILPLVVGEARRLAEQEQPLDAYLASIQRWSEAVAAAARETLEPALLADTLEQLNLLLAQVLGVTTQAYVEVRTRDAEKNALAARRGMTRLLALQRINAAANSTLDLDQTLNTTAQVVAEEMGVDLCVIHLFDDISRELQLRAVSGQTSRMLGHVTQGLGRGYSGWVAEHGHPLMIADVTADSHFAPEAAMYGDMYRGLLSVPIIYFTVLKLEGVISVQTREPRVFSEEEITFLEIVAGQLAMNIENGRLYEQTDEELRRKVHELSALHRVSALVTSTLVLDNVLRIIVQQAVQLSGADRSILFELDPATQRLRAVASHGFDDQRVMSAEVRVGDCCVGRVVRSAEPSMQVDCMRNDETCFLRELPEAIDDQHAILCAPLMTMRGPLGALCVFSSQRHMLSAHQLQLVVTFANVAAIAMENARLFEQTRQGLKTKEILLREMHHRVKNNLQQVASILNMQRRRAKSPEVEQILGESVDSIQGIAAAHDLLSGSLLGMAPLDELARKICGIVGSNLVPPQMHIRFSVNPAPFNVASEEATTLAIILNELIANAIEHGFEGRTRGAIRISGAREDDYLIVRVADDGLGLPEGFSVASAEGLGLQLVRSLVQSNLNGTVRMFTMTGNPDLKPSPEAAASTNPLMEAIQTRPDGTIVSMADETQWTVAELRFPLIAATPEEAGAEALR